MIAFCIACNAVSNIPIEEHENLAFGVKAISNPVYKEGGNVVFILENTTDSSRYILEPSRLTIQKMIDSAWYDIRMLPCPCGASCAPPEYYEIKAFDQMDLSWNEKESWCRIPNEPGTDRSEYVKRGTYRIVLKINDSPEKDQVDDQELIVQFKIL